ncbi:cadmium resistance transporter [Limosilactobacillus oris]|uniref:cadmium resistance transporter n=1 Tax=Limosilactobacillus oris TaxID=1632 RepID=UPI00174C3E6A|nr:cadmium resistance transporter [Limosilactobacillus oris]
MAFLHLPPIRWLTSFYNPPFFFILLFLLKKYKVRDVILGYVTGVLILVAASFFLGKILAIFMPEWLLGILGFLPIWMAIHDNDEEANQTEKASPILTVLITYLAVCAGCNLSILLPILIGVSLIHFGEVLLFVIVFTTIIVLLLKGIGEIPIVNNFMSKYSEISTKIVYIGVGLYVVWDSGLISHLIGLL